jgi:hypothetical protein
MAEHRSPGWRELLQDALSESNPEKLPEKIARAEVAVCRKIKQVKLKARTRAELEDALKSLSVLKKRHFPDWNSRLPKR